MINNVTELIRVQIHSLQAELKSTSDEKRIIEINRLIEENKNILETKYNELLRHNGETLGEFEERVSKKPIAPKRATGIALLDNHFDGGFEEGMFINLIGESGAGKSTLMLEMLMNISAYSKSVFFGFEMSDRITLNKIRHFGITDAHRRNLVIDIHSRNLETLKREVLLYAKEGVKFFVIDSKMKLEVEGAMDDHKKISQISSELSKLTQQNDIIIVLINQISEENLKTGRVSIKGSGDQIYDTDIVLVYRKVKNDPSKRELQVYKNRQNDKEGVIETKLDGYRTISTKMCEVVEYQVNNKDNGFLRGLAG